MWGKIFGKVLSRLAEPSTYAGLAAVVAGVGSVGGINEAPAVAQAVGSAGDAAASYGPWGGLLALGMGALAVLVPEKGKKG